jgi:predicted esterase
MQRKLPGLVALLGALLAAAACSEGIDDEPTCLGDASCLYDSSTGTILPGATGGNDAGSGVLPGATTGGAVVPGTTGGAGATTGGAGATTGGTGTPGGGTAGLFDGGFPGGLGGRGDAGTTNPDPGSDASLPPVTGGTEPKLPPIMGECPEFKNGTIMVAGHRGVQLTVGAPNKGGPLYFFWHGTGGRAANVSSVPASIRNEVIALGGIIASFDGASSSGTEGDCSGTGAHNIADFKAADQIAACAVKNHGIDPRRIYTTGCSAGGLQSGCMAQLRSSYIAAAAPNSGGVTRNQRWQDAGKPAILSMHGGPSDMVIVTFSQTSNTLNMSAKQHGSFVVNCDHGGGHCRAPAALYEASWKFMKDHPYGIAESPWKNGIPAGVPNYCKIF